MKNKRLLSIITMVMVLTTTIFTGCANNQEKEPAKEENKEVRILTYVTGGKDEEEMKLFEEALEKGTGLQITMEKPASDYDNVLMQKLQAGEKYDLVYMLQGQVPSLVDQGALTDITKYVEQSKVLSDDKVIPKSEWDSIKLDGKIYAGFNKKEVHRVVNVNSVIAEKAGVKVQEIQPTLDGYYQAFKAMKEKGGDQTFYPFNVSFVKMHDLQPWFSSVGLKGGIVLENSKRTVPWSTDAAAPVWEWLAKLYNEGLLDPDCVTDGTKELRNKFQTGKTGIVPDWAAWTGLYNANAGKAYPAEFKAVPLPGTKKTGGEYMLTRGAASLWGVPSNAENVQGAIKVLEYLASQEGGVLGSLGIEGKDYTKEGDKYVLTEQGKKHGSDHGIPVPINESYKNPIGWNPGFEDAMGYLKYSSTELAVSQTSKYAEIVSKHGVQIVKGSVDVKAGLDAMRKELKLAGVTE